MMRVLVCPVCYGLLGTAEIIPSSRYEEGCNRHSEDKVIVDWTGRAEFLAKSLVLCKECGYSYDVVKDDSNVPYLTHPLKRR